MKEVLTLAQLAQTQIEEPGSMAVDQHDAETGKRSQQLGERFQMEMAVHGELRAAELRGQIVFAPDNLARSRRIPPWRGHRVARRYLQIMRQTHDAVEIGAGRFAFT